MATGTVVASHVEEAKRQARLNDTLRRAVLDADECARRSHQSLNVSRLRGDAMRHCQRSLEQLAEFEKIADFSYTRRFNAGILLEETGQRVGLDRLIKPGDRGTVEALQNTMDTLKRMKALKGVQSGPGSSTALSTFCSSALDTLDKAVTLMRDTALESDEWARMHEGLFMLLEEVASIPAAAEVIEDERERIARMQFEVEELEHRQEEALAEGDMKAMEEIYFQRVTVQEAMVGVFDSIFKRLDDHAALAHVQPTKRVGDVHQSCSGDVSAVMHRTESLKQAVEDDLTRLKKAKAEVESTENARRIQANRLKEQSDAYLKSNQMQLEQCYSAMEEIQKQVTKLAADRTDALEQRLRFIQEENAFAADVANFNSFFKQHLGLLESTLQTLEVSEEITDLVDEGLCAGCNAVEQRARDNLAEIEQCRMETHESRLKQFRQLYLTLGDLQYKKERNMEELEKKIEHTHIQQELAMETFNPKAKEYSEAKKQLLAVRDEMQSQVEVLRDKATLHIEAFKPTEAALIDAGKSFTHPVEELQQMNERRQQKLIEYNKLMSTESGGSPENDDPNGFAPARATEEELEAEMQRIQAEKAAHQQRSNTRFRQSSRGVGASQEL